MLRPRPQKSNNDVNAAINAYFEDPVGSLKELVSLYNNPAIGRCSCSDSHLQINGRIRTIFHVSEALAAHHHMLERLMLT
jgi:hypothetical protein